MIKIAIVGIGNCSSSLIQTINAAKTNTLKHGVSHPKIGGYGIQDIKVVCAFDIDQRKIGKDLSEAIFSPPNCTTKYTEVEVSNVIVKPGILLDGVSDHMLDSFQIAETSKTISLNDITNELKKSGAEVVVNYLPVGANEASLAYATAALNANCGFINCTPAPLAVNADLQSKFKEKGLPILGDDVKSQVGSTAIHRALLDLLSKKGIKITNSYQLNIGGNTDFKNMRNPARGINKKITKEASLNDLLDADAEMGVGPSDYVPHLKDNKVGYINIAGVGLLGMPFSLELKLTVEDSPNSAGVVINAIRSAKVALDRNLSGAIHSVCPYLFKNPPERIGEKEIFSEFDMFAI